MGKIKDVQAKMNSAKENLVHLRVTSESGAGMVKATINGLRQIVKLEVDSDLLKPEDKDMLQDLTVAAVNKALAEIDEKIKEEMKKVQKDCCQTYQDSTLTICFKKWRELP